VAKVQAELFTNMADTFAAIDHNPANLQAAIAKAPLDARQPPPRASRSSSRSSPISPTSRTGLRPVAASLPHTLPALNTAFKYGTSVLPKTVPLNQGTGKLFDALDDLLARNPNTLLALKDLTTTVGRRRARCSPTSPPYQTVCNQTVYFLTGPGRPHVPRT